MLALKHDIHNATTRFFTPKLMTMASAGAIWGEYLPDGGDFLLHCQGDMKLTGYSIGRYQTVLCVPNSNQEVGSPRRRKWWGWHDALGVFADKGNAEVILTADM